METIRKISLEHDPGILRQDLDKYIELAIGKGATAALAVSADRIPIDERVRMKCRHPLCFGYGNSMNCPPHTGSVEDTRELVKLFKYGIALKMDVKSDRVVNPGAIEEEIGIKDLRKLCEIISAVESAAFHDGYYFAAGFASASCNLVWCKGLECQALLQKGCRMHGRAYASMEAVGIDVFRLAATIGWDVYPIGSQTPEDMIPHGSRCGLVLIE